MAKSILEAFKSQIRYYLNIGLSVRCIYILINEELKKEGTSIGYQAVLNFVNKLKRQKK